MPVRRSAALQAVSQIGSLRSLRLLTMPKLLCRHLNTPASSEATFGHDGPRGCASRFYSDHGFRHSAVCKTWRQDLSLANCKKGVVRTRTRAGREVARAFRYNGIRHRLVVVCSSCSRCWNTWIVYRYFCLLCLLCATKRNISVLFWSK